MTPFCLTRVWESTDFVRKPDALHDESVEVQYVIFPAHAHFPRNPVRGEEIYKRWIAWFADHLR